LFVLQFLRHEKKPRCEDIASPSRRRNRHHVERRLPWADQRRRQPPRYRRISRALESRTTGSGRCDTPAPRPVRASKRGDRSCDEKTYGLISHGRRECPIRHDAGRCRHVSPGILDRAGATESFRQRRNASSRAAPRSGWRRVISR
jgi:hypothetical protein